ncbi:MAG: TlpA disulfide reductase family protein [Hydrogenothermaceae bacterium]
MRYIILLVILIIGFSFGLSKVRLYDKSGNEVPLPQDKIIILNFMAYSCRYCMAEIPIFKKVLKEPEFKDKFVIYGFALDGKENNFQDRNFPIYANNPNNNVLFPTMGTPTTYIISPSGRKLLTIYGAVTEENLRKFLKETLKKVNN